MHPRLFAGLGPNLGPISAGVWTDVDHNQTRPDVDQIWLSVNQIWPGFDHILDEFGQMWPDVDQIWPDLDQSWAGVGQTEPIKVWPTWAKFVPGVDHFIMLGRVGVCGGQVGWSGTRGGREGGLTKGRPTNVATSHVERPCA